MQIRASGVPESKIYSIFLYEPNEQTFHPIKVVEKTAPIAISNVATDTTYRRAMEHTLAWTGGEIFERLRLDLYKETSGQPELVRAIDSSFVNDNSIEFAVDKKVKPQIPDVVVNGNHVIDAKFPCDTSKPNAPLRKQKCTSATKAADEMDTKKEDSVYTKIRERKIRDSEAMTPNDARDRLADNGCADCQCKYDDAATAG